MLNPFAANDSTELLTQLLGRIVSGPRVADAWVRWMMSDPGARKQLALTPEEEKAFEAYLWANSADVSSE